MDANQDGLSNPYGMDEDCTNCDLCTARERVVHGYGDVGADFLFVGESLSASDEAAGVPLATDPTFRRILERLMLCASQSPADQPELANSFCTVLTRCRHPDRDATDEEVATCEPYLNAEVRMINPEILIPVGERALAELGEEYTTKPASELDVQEHHGETIRGRGFELVPMIAPENQTDEDTQTFVEQFASLMARDYRQTKGRRSR
ncbi:uracil-DNA glycosylase family protein [Haloarchaeobius sp. DFWS5]|uniref:uracil-DNA glycosylase family protein n=1 Tax=Haloarchaeobius sp. DFWS5 TaxID=3446114 RepID=UPI003EB8365C